MRRKHIKKTLILMAIILSIIACSSLPIVKLGPAGNATAQVVADIPYCDANASVLCLISFGIDNKGQMFINFYKPDLPIRDFYLKVQYNQEENVYECQVIKGHTRYISCTGKQIPLEEQIDIAVYLSKDDTLIARGTFVISAFAIATPVIVTMTEGTSDLTSVPATSTQTPQVIRTPTRSPTVAFTSNTNMPTPSVTRTSITPIAGNSSVTTTPTLTPTSTRTVTPTRTTLP
jgi:hypothetical protein